MTDRRLRLISGSPESAQAILEVLDGTTIGVEVEDDPPWRRQVLAGALVDLLCRLFPEIAITAPLSVAAKLEEIRRHGVTPRAPTSEPNVRVVVGGGKPSPGAIYCDGDGWQSYLGPSPSKLTAPGDATVPIGPLAAACRAAGRAFVNAAVRFRGDVAPLEPAYWSGLTFASSSEPLDEAKVATPTRIQALLCGAGSIGGAAAYAFARVPSLTGELDVVDPQNYEPHNPDRAILATEAVAEAGGEKAQTVADALSHLPNLEVRPYRGTLRSWVASRPASPLPLVLCAFDSVDSRRELQDALPLEVINAACSEDHVAISGHRTGDGPCIYCLHVPEVLDSERFLFKLIVATTKLPPRLVQGWIENQVRLNAQQISGIEQNRGLPLGSLATFVGATIVELYVGALRYGEDALQLEDTTAAVAAPWVTALAGFVLAGETLKASAHEAYAPYRLGPWQPGRTQYVENLYASARHGMLVPVARWEGPECLCRSTRRLRILSERYGIGQSEL